MSTLCRRIKNKHIHTDPKWLRPFRYKLEEALSEYEIEPYTANAALEFLKSIGSRVARHLWLYTHTGNAEFVWEDYNADDRTKFLSFEFDNIGSREQILHLMRLISVRDVEWDRWVDGRL